VIIPEIPNSVMILRERHPFEGRSLQVMSAIKRRHSAAAPRTARRQPFAYPRDLDQ
jgi:hypothetical protein